MKTETKNMIDDFYGNIEAELLDAAHEYESAIACLLNERLSGTRAEQDLILSELDEYLRAPTHMSVRETLDNLTAGNPAVRGKQ